MAADSDPPAERDLSELLPQVYEEARRVAAHYMRGEAIQTLRPTELVHEAYLRLSKGHPRAIADRAHLLALIATAMRHELVDRARARKALKRGGGATLVTLSEALPTRGLFEDLLELDDALERLQAVDPRAARAFLLCEYAGHTHEQSAELLQVSVRTIQNDLIVARTWLYRELTEDQNGDR